MDLQHLRASDGTGEAVLAHVTVTRTIGSTTLKLDNVDNWNGKAIIITGTPNAAGYINTAGMKVMYGHISAGDFIIDGYAPGYTDNGNTTTEVAIVKMCTAWADALVDILKIAHNDDGSFKNSAFNGGWMLGDLPAVTSVTHNGLHSVDIVFASTVAALLCPGMRIRTTRTLAAPNQGANLVKASTQHFAKVGSLTGLAQTDNITVMAHVKLNDYDATNGHAIVSQRTGTNGWDLYVDVDGQVRIHGLTSAGNYKLFKTRTCLPRGRKVHVAATINMAGSAATIYFDGQSQPLYTAHSGTSTAITPATTIAIGATYSSGSAASPWDGKIWQVAVFSTVLSQATIRQYATIPLVGNEASCVGLWKLSGSTGDSSANNNTLTANNGASTTDADSPFGTQADGTISTTLDYGIVMAISSNGLTATVQYPDGNTIPATGGITAIARSHHKAPFGFPGDKNKWRNISVWAGNDNIAIGAVTTWTGSNVNLVVKPGKWMVGCHGSVGLTSTVAGARNGAVAFDLSSRLVNNKYNSRRLVDLLDNTSVSALIRAIYTEYEEDLAAEATFNLSASIYTASGSETWQVRGDRGLFTTYADNMYV